MQDRINGFTRLMGGSWDEMDEQMAREGAAIKKSFHSTAVRGTPKRKARVAGGPKNRKDRQGLLRVQ